MPRKRKGPSKALQIQREVDDVRRMLASGKSVWQCVRFVEDVYGHSRRTGENRVKAAKEQMMEEVGRVDRRELAAQMLEAYENVLSNANERGQLSASLGAIGGICRLAKLVDKDN